jgi:aminoglycoside phosphotransferase (APT) family kinase protein
VHGDPAFNNLIMQDNKIVALIDWEYSHVGDPMEDLSYVRVGIEHFMPWEDFLDTYYRFGGQKYDEQRGRFYQVWRNVRNMVALVVGCQTFKDSQNTDCKFAWTSTMAPSMYREATEVMATVKF